MTKLIKNIIEKECSLYKSRLAEQKDMCVFGQKCFKFDGSDKECPQFDNDVIDYHIKYNKEEKIRRKNEK